MTIAVFDHSTLYGFAVEKATSSTEVHLVHLAVDVSVEAKSAEHFDDDVDHEGEAKHRVDVC